MGTFYRPEEAIAAYQKALHRENPGLHTPPVPSDVPNLPGANAKTNPDMDSTSMVQRDSERPCTLPRNGV
jgi:hypothetical protein